MSPASIKRLAGASRKDLQRIVDAGQVARRKLNALDTEDKRRENMKLIGKCYRYRNSYSCPETEADYWWFYAKVIGLDDEGDTLLVREFQVDKNGDISIAPRQSRWSLIDGYLEISSEAFDARWADLMSTLAALS